jgi:uncharacterized membrane protein
METVSKKSRILAAISYVPFPPLFLVTLFAAPHDSFDEFHGKQGLVVFLAAFIVWILSFVPLVGIAAYLGVVAIIVADIIAIAQALTGRRWQIPVLGRYAQKIKF